MPPSPTNQCFACGNEYLVLGGNSGNCPECGARATSLVGETAVLDVRKQARLQTPAKGDRVATTDVVEIVVADETDRLFVYYVSGPESDSPEIATVRIEDTRLQCVDDHWSAEIVPNSVLWAVQDEYDVLPTVADRQIR